MIRYIHCHYFRAIIHCAHRQLDPHSYPNPYRYPNPHRHLGGLHAPALVENKGAMVFVGVYVFLGVPLYSWFIGHFAGVLLWSECPGART